MTTSDGVRIGWCEAGEGPPLLLTAANTLSDVQLEWQHDVWAGWYEALVATGRRVIRYDSRGSGQSDRDTPATTEGFVADLDAVVGQIGVERFDLLASWSMAPVGIRYAVDNPDRVAHLVLWTPLIKYDDLPPIAPSLLHLAETNWEFFTETVMRVGAETAKEDADAREIAAVWREATTVDAYLRYVSWLQTVDVTDDLARITAPTLVVHTRMTVPPLAVSQRIAGAVPGASLTVVNGNGWLPLRDEVDDVAALIAEFIDGASSPARAQRGGGRICTVLFTDIVGHTEMMRRLGDDAGREVLRDHEQLVRRVLVAHGGAEVKTLGDGFMVWFDSVADALNCAATLQRTCAERNDRADIPLQLRVGLNAGEPIAEDDDLFGETVILAARVTAQAGAGEVLVPDHVRHLAAGKGFSFSPRGEFKPKGFDEAIGISLLEWR